MVDKPTPSQMQLENHTIKSRNAREHRHRNHSLDQRLNKKQKKKNQNPNLTEAIYDEPPSFSNKSDPIPQLEQMLSTSIDIIIQPLIVINLDGDDEVAKIDEEVYVELSTLFSSSISLNEKSSVELGVCPSTAMDIVPLASGLSSIYTDRDWEVD
jgi:hypothetical protein